MMAVSTSERIEILEEVLEKMDECSELLRRLNDPQIEAYCLADFEGRERGWMGKFVRDILEEKLDEARHPEEEDAG
jgi:hypothetical protein